MPAAAWYDRKKREETAMGFDWGDEQYRYRVHVVRLADGRYGWRLAINGPAGTGTAESVEVGTQAFDDADAAEAAGNERMVALARAERNRSG
jgi:hypothetical protein